MPLPEKNDTKPAFFHLRGSLGSQMFQVAAGYAFAKRYNRRLALPGFSEGQTRRQYYESYFHQMAKHISPPVAGDRYVEPMYSHWEIPEEAVDIYGYFQSSKYFADYAADIRRLFTLPDDVKATVETRWADVLAAADKGIVLDLRASAHGFLTQDYYERGLATIKATDPDAPVFVFSDDVEWIQRLPWLKSVATVVAEKNEAAAMYVMSRFRRFVLSNTAYSWWAAWLSGGAEKQVVVPATWNDPKGPQDFQDVYEEGWTRIPNTV
jgi:hypothetical protein